MDTNKQVYIKELRIKDYKCFKGDNTFSFIHDSEQEQSFKVCQWTVLLGNNGTGKTNILKAIANMEPRKEYHTNKKDNDNLPYDSIAFINSSNNETKEELYSPKVIERYKKGTYKILCNFAITENKGQSLPNHWCKDLPKLGLTQEGKPVRFSTVVFGYGPTFNAVDSSPELENLKIYAYGVNRISDSTGLNKELKDTAASLFDENISLLNLEDWLLQLELAKRTKPEVVDRVELLKKVFSGSSILPDIKDFTLVTDDNFNNHIEFKCNDGSFRFNELGYGYQCMLAWIFDFSKRMFDRYPDSKNPLAEAAVVIIDEIDLHLHPKWQRTLLKDLSDLFPNTQFIVSTHSPLIIQSIEGINLFVLKHQNDGSIQTERMSRNWEGWEIDEILQEAMDVDNSLISKSLQAQMDEFDKAITADDLEKAEQLYSILDQAVNPNGTLKQMINAQIRLLRNTHEKD